MGSCKITFSAVSRSFLAGIILFLVSGPLHAEEQNRKPKGTFSETLKRGEHPGREYDQQPDRVIESLGVRPGDSVCDIGAGSGFFTFRLASAVGESGKVYAVDIDQDSIKYIKNRMESTGTKNVIPVLSEETDPRLPPVSCDKVLIVNTYYRFRAPVTIMKNIRNAVKTGGEVAVIGVKKDAPVRGPYGRLTDLRVSREEVLSQMSEAGYLFSRSYDYLATQYFLIFRVKP